MSENIKSPRISRWFLLLLIPLILALGFVVWAISGPGAMPDAHKALISDSRVSVADDQWLVFSPTDASPTSGLIIYPGARVDPEAYAPLARAVAAEGYLAVIVPMPLNLAFLGADRALEVIEQYPEISSWVVGGHSLGGAMAASFAHSHPESLDGLILWAAYPAQSDDLSGQDLLVSSIYGKNDGLTSLDEIKASESLLPPDTRWAAIEGGNHGQFGWYGEQAGDNEAAISREDQQELVIRATLDLMGVLPGGGR
jgi:predicted esterase